MLRLSFSAKKTCVNTTCSCYYTRKAPSYNAASIAQIVVTCCDRPPGHMGDDETATIGGMHETFGQPSYLTSARESRKVDDIP